MLEKSQYGDFSRVSGGRIDKCIHQYASFNRSSINNLEGC